MFYMVVSLAVFSEAGSRVRMNRTVVKSMKHKQMVKVRDILLILVVRQCRHLKPQTRASV